MSKPNRLDNILNIGLILYSCIGSQAHKLKIELEFGLTIMNQVTLSRTQVLKLSNDPKLKHSL